MRATAHPELSRDYFEREARKGRRVIFLWHVSKRWPEYEPSTGDEWIEGAAFLTSDAAMRFDMAELDGDAAAHGAWMLFETWDEAEEWLTTITN